MAGYDERNCQINIDDCQPDPWFNGGVCMDSTSKFSCMCPPHILEWIVKKLLNLVPINSSHVQHVLMVMMVMMMMMININAYTL